MNDLTFDGSKGLDLTFGHLSTLIRLPSPTFRDDIEWVISRRRPWWLSMTEVGGRRPEVREVLRGTGYQVAWHQARECALIFDARAGVELVSVGQELAHPDGPDFPERYLHWSHLAYEGEHIWVHYAHWLAHLSDSRLRVQAHNDMTETAVRIAKRHAQGRHISIVQGDANEVDKSGSREDGLRGNMATQFRKGGLETIWDETREYPSTFGNRGPIDIIATLIEDRRLLVRRARAINVKSDHDYVEAEAELLTSA